MPQTNDRLRALFEDDSHARDVLESAGWTCAGGWWDVPAHEPTGHEWDAIQYLVEEWDHGIRKSPAPAQPTTNEILARG
jgi:hypothetical protein